MSNTVTGGQSLLPLLELLAELVATLLPEMERLGVTNATDIGIDTLVERMLNDAIANSSVIIGHYQIGAWSRL